MSSSGTPKRLSGPALLGNAAATIYTAPAYIPATLVTVIRKLHFFNQDTVSRNVTVSIGADAAGTEILTTFSIATLQPYILPGPFTIAQGGTVQAFADIANKVTLTMDGLENVGP